MVTDEIATPEYISWIDSISRRAGSGVAALLHILASYQEFSKELAALNGHLSLLYITNPAWLEVM